MDARSLPPRIELPPLPGRSGLQVATDVAAQAGAITSQGLSLLERWKRRLRYMVRRISKRVLRIVRVLYRWAVLTFRKRVVKKMRGRRRYRRPALPE